MNEFALLEQHLNDWLKIASGIALAIVREGEIVYENGFGTYNDAPLTAKTPVEVASLSKPVFAYAILKLCECGVLDLDTPICEYLPQPYLTDEPFLPLMTIRHALSHTTGFPNWRDEAGLRSAFRPGTAFNYSTEGLIYLQTAMENIIAQPFVENLWANVLEPLGMAHSYFAPIEMVGMPDYLPRHVSSFGAVSLVTTASDYARFVIETFHTGDGDTYRLNQTTIDQMLTPHIPVGDQQGLWWGLGWSLQEVDGQTAFWHWGQRRSRTRNFAMGFPHNCSGIVILSVGGDGLPICEEITKLVMNVDELPAFRWLLPPEQWRADGRIIK